MKQQVDAELGEGRSTCWQCYRVRSLCLCPGITRFTVKPLIALLVHPKEYQRTVGTARVVKLSIANAKLWTGYGPDFDVNPEIIELVSDQKYHPVVLYPGKDSLNVSTASAESIAHLLPSGKQLVIFVIDGTWPNAKRMIRQSRILGELPKISFEVRKTSQYEFRKQPHSYCLSTVEAVCELVEQLELKGLAQVTPPRAHYQMIQVFQNLVKGQLRAQVELRKPRFVP